MTRIFIFTGPESSGKTTMAQLLSNYLSAPMVHEHAREYLDEKKQADPDFQYTRDDLVDIARKQYAEEQHFIELNPENLVCDTDLLVLIVWSEVKFGACDPWIIGKFKDSLDIPDRHYILCDWQIPWEEDPQREHPDDREAIFRLYQKRMDEFDIPYTAISGSNVQRFKQIYALLESLGSGSV